MLKLFLRIFIVIIVGSVSWYFGYSSGAKNQKYFDAAARASLYDKAVSLNDEEAIQMLKNFLFKQKCILSSDFNYDTYTVYHPIHSEVLGYYNSNIQRICGDSGCDCIVPK